MKYYITLHYITIGKHMYTCLDKELRTATILYANEISETNIVVETKGLVLKR